MKNKLESPVIGMVVLIVALAIQSWRLVDAQFEIKELHAQAARSQQDALDRIKRCMELKGGGGGGAQ